MLPYLSALPHHPHTLNTYIHRLLEENNPVREPEPLAFLITATVPWGVNEQMGAQQQEAFSFTGPGGVLGPAPPPFECGTYARGRMPSFKCVLGLFTCGQSPPPSDPTRTRTRTLQEGPFRPPLPAPVPARDAGRDAGGGQGQHPPQPRRGAPPLARAVRA